MQRDRQQLGAEPIELFAMKSDLFARDQAFGEEVSEMRRDLLQTKQRQ